MLWLTGSAGLISTHFILNWRQGSNEPIVNPNWLSDARKPEHRHQLQGNICQILVARNMGHSQLTSDLLHQDRPRAMVQLAAKSHVDRSIEAPEASIQTHIVGSFKLLPASQAWRLELRAKKQAAFRFLHVFTDEVYAGLSKSSQTAPRNPCAASKAASDHLLRAWHQTHGLPVPTSHSSNNYGPNQLPEKLISHLIVCALVNQESPLYHDGLHARNWLYVKDHCSTLRCLLQNEQPGQSCNISANNEETNLAAAYSVCVWLDALRPRADSRSCRQQIRLVRNRAGHNQRYAIDSASIKRQLGWQAQIDFASDMHQTIPQHLEQIA